MSSRRRDESRSRSPERLPKGAQEITEKDFFLKNDEFRLWLKEEKDKASTIAQNRIYFTELSGEKARSYFRKFVKSWNKGRLSSRYYHGIGTSQDSAAASTSYRWAFASSDKVSEKEIKGAREAVREATNGNMETSSSSRPVHGPALPTPSASDRQYDREEEEERLRRERTMNRKRARAEENERIEDAIGPREVGRERMQENKRARRENDRAFREKDVEPDIDADALMGGGDSFHAMIAKRDAAKKRFEEKRRGEKEVKEQAKSERMDSIRAKDKATMDMFKALAKERFG